MIKVQKSLMLMKLVPSLRVHRADSNCILNFKNGLCMSERTRSEVIVKQEKKGICRPSGSLTS